MRDLINLTESLSEASNLAASEFTNRPKRWETFISKIQNREPFITVDQEEVYIDPKEAGRLLKLKDAGMFRGIIKVKTIFGDEIPISKLAKQQNLAAAPPAKKVKSLAKKVFF